MVESYPWHNQKPNFSLVVDEVSNIELPHAIVVLGRLLFACQSLSLFCVPCCVYFRFTHSDNSSRRITLSTGTKISLELYMHDVHLVKFELLSSFVGHFELLTSKNLENWFIKMRKS